MKISVFGLGYVGTVAAACLAKESHDVIGVDANESKVEMINKGFSPVIENDLGSIIEAAVANNKLEATTDAQYAVLNSELSMVCVGTPSQMNGSLNLKYLRRVSKDIGGALREKRGYHVVVVRSTMLPGSMTDVVIPTLEHFSSKKTGEDFGVCFNPEFMREGTAVYDYLNPPRVVIGENDKRAGDLLVGLYEKINAPLFRAGLDTGEMLKYADNVWHALKVSFANEIGNICKEMGIDSHEVMEIFCEDKKLNLSSYYLKPGFAFGGSCLPKDVRALTFKARTLDLELPLLNAILPSNVRQIERALELIIHQNRRKIGILGFSFKAGTDDLRESPMVEIIERLLGKGYDIKIYDKSVNIASLVGANKDYILNVIPHISKLMVQNMETVLEHAETVVIGNRGSGLESILPNLRARQVVVDLVRICDRKSAPGRYEGICW